MRRIRDGTRCHQCTMHRHASSDRRVALRVDPKRVGQPTRIAHQTIGNRESGRRQSWSREAVLDAGRPWCCMSSRTPATGCRHRDPCRDEGVCSPAGRNADWLAETTGTLNRPAALHEVRPAMDELRHIPGESRSARSHNDRVRGRSMWRLVAMRRWHASCGGGDPGCFCFGARGLNRQIAWTIAPGGG